MGDDAGRSVSAVGGAGGTKKIFCGIDPGREKFGFAICDDHTLLFSAIAPIDALNTAILSLASGDFSGMSLWQTDGHAPRRDLQIGAVFLGDGTGHEMFARALSAHNVAFALSDERMTTQGARALYWQLHPPKRLWRIIPLSLRVPPRPIDDLAAWAIVRKARSPENKEQESSALS